MSFTRYHEDGTPSRIGTYIDGQPFGAITWIRSDSPTIEQYPPNAGPNVWKTVSTVKNGYTVEEHYYDKEGKEIQEPYIGDVEISELLKKMGVMDRFNIDKDWKRLLAEAHEVLDENLAGDDDRDQMKVVFYKAISLYELNNEEVNEDIEELAEDIKDLRTFEIFHFLKEYDIHKEAIKFAKMVLPDDDDDDDEEQKEDRVEFISYPNATLSPDGKYIVLGSQMSSHIVLENRGGNWVEIDSINPVSEYPHSVLFNYKTKEPIVALSSCHAMYGSGTIGATVGGFGKPHDEINDDTVWDMKKHDSYFINDRWTFGMLDVETGFWLGSNDGYLWHKNLNTGKLHYVYIGPTPTSIDISPDGEHMVVGTYAGQVLILKLTKLNDAEEKNPRIDPYLITNTPFVDEKRYLFFKSYNPLVW